METEIELGDKVEDIYTGFKGTVMAKTEFINGCVQFSIVPKWTKDKDPMVMDVSIDSKSLKVIKKAKPKEDDDYSSGGPMTRIQRRNY